VRISNSKVANCDLYCIEPQALTVNKTFFIALGSIAGNRLALLRYAVARIHKLKLYG